MDVMGWIGWLIVGGVAGWLATAVMGHQKGGVIVSVIVGIIGGLIGGYLFKMLGAPGVTGFNLWSLFVAFVGAVVLLALVRLFTGPAAK